MQYSHYHSRFGGEDPRRSRQVPRQSIDSNVAETPVQMTRFQRPVFEKPCSKSCCSKQSSVQRQTAVSNCSSSELIANLLSNFESRSSAQPPSDFRHYRRDRWQPTHQRTSEFSADSHAPYATTLTTASRNELLPAHQVTTAATPAGILERPWLYGPEYPTPSNPRPTSDRAFMADRHLNTGTSTPDSKLPQHDRSFHESTSFIHNLVHHIPSEVIMLLAAYAPKNNVEYLIQNLRKVSEQPLQVAPQKIVEHDDDDTNITVVIGPINPLPLYIGRKWEQSLFMRHATSCSALESSNLSPLRKNRNLLTSDRCASTERCKFHPVPNCK